MAVERDAVREGGGVLPRRVARGSDVFECRFLFARKIPIVAVNGEGHGEHLTAPAGNQEDVRAPPLIGRRLLHLAEAVSIALSPASSALPSSRATERAPTRW